MTERKKIGYRYFYGSCIGILLFILILTFNYIRFGDMILIIADLTLIFIISRFIKKRSDKLTEQFEFRMYFQESSRLQISQVGESKKIKTYKDIFINRCQLAIWLFVIYFLIGIFGCLLVFFHEIGHLLTAISFKVNIIEIFLSPLYGYVLLSGEIPVMQLNSIALSGGLGVIISGTILLLLLHWNDRLTLTFQIPLNCIIIYAIWDNLRYFWVGAINLPNNYDMGLILQRNPALNPLLILYICLFWWALVLIFSSWSFFKKFVNDAIILRNAIFPDLSLFDNHSRANNQ